MSKRLKMFLWRYFMDRLSTKSRLGKELYVDDTSCYFCGCERELSFHIFLECEYAKMV